MVPPMRRELVAQLQHHALRSFFADARNLGEPRNIVASDRRGHFIRRHPAENGDRQLRPDTAHRHQFLEQLLFGGTQKSIQRNDVFAHVGVNVKRRLRRRLAGNPEKSAH